MSKARQHAEQRGSSANTKSSSISALEREFGAANKGQPDLSIIKEAEDVSGFLVAPTEEDPNLLRDDVLSPTSDLSLPESMMITNTQTGSKGDMMGEDGSKPFLLGPNRQLQERNRQLESELSLLQEQLNYEREQYQRHSKRIRLKSENDLKLVHDRIGDLTKEIPLLRQKLKDAQSDIVAFFESGGISAQRYDDLKSLPLESLSLKELAGIKAFEQISIYKEKLRSMRHAVENATELGIRVKELETTNNRLENANIKYISQIASLEREVNDNREKVTSYTNLESQLAIAQKAERRATASKEATSQMLIALRKDTDNAKETVHGLEKKISLLKMDKEFLNKENTRHKSQLQHMTEKNNRLEDQLAKLASEKAAAVDNLLGREMSHKEKITEEMTKQRLAIEQQSRSREDAMQRAFDRELRFHKEASSSLLEKYEKCELRNAALTKEIDVLKSQLTENKEGTRDEIISLQEELRNSTWEKATLESKLGELTETKRLLTLETDMLKEKNQVLREEYSLLETKSLKEQARQEIRIETLSSTLKGYEMLESEVDKAIETTAITETDMIQTSSARRVSHALGLARELLEVKRERDTLQKENDELQVELKRNVKQRDLAERNLQLLRDTSDVKGFMMNAIETRETKIRELKKELERSMEREDRLEGRVVHLMELNNEVEKLKRKLAKSSSSRRKRVLAGSPSASPAPKNISKNKTTTNNATTAMQDSGQALAPSPLSTSTKGNITIPQELMTRSLHNDDSMNSSMDWHTKS
eukprot:g1898.t1